MVAFKGSREAFKFEAALGDKAPGQDRGLFDRSAAREGDHRS